MPRFDLILVLDWSAAGRPGRGADSIWLGADDAAPLNPPTRAAAAALLRERLSHARDAGRRVLLGVDFALGHPAGLAAAITGQPGALTLWAALDEWHRDDDRNRSNYRDMAARMNRKLGRPLFWGNGCRRQIPDLPRTRPPPDPLVPTHRRTDAPVPGGPRPKSPFQLAGAGSVGAQSLTGIPWLNRLRHDCGAVVWPFQPWAGAPVVMAEVYPSMIAEAVAASRGHACRDAAQVDLLARALRRLDDADQLAGMLAPDPRIPDLQAEGQILGFAHEDLLRRAAVPHD